MDLDLKAFSLTLAAGLAMIVVTTWLLAITFPEIPKWLGEQLVKSKETTSFGVVALVVGVLAVGILVEDFSKNAVSERDPTMLGPIFRDFVHSEKRLRVQLLLDKKDNVDGSKKSSAQRWDELCLDGMLGKGQKKDKGVSWKLDEEATRILTTLHVAEPTLSEGRMLSSLVGDKFPTLSNEDLLLVGPRDCDQLGRQIQTLYYLAKNRVYEKESFVKEVEEFRTRYNFTRSLTYVFFLGEYLCWLLYLGHNCRALLDDQGRVRTWGGFLSGIGLVAPIVTFMVLALFSSMDSQSEPSWALILAMTPLAFFLWMTLYRFRRLPTKFFLWSAANRLQREDPERHIPVWWDLEERTTVRIWRAAIVMALLFLMLRGAYESDFENYTMRVYGYYASIRSCPTETTKAGETKCIAQAKKE